MARKESTREARAPAFHNDPISWSLSPTVAAAPSPPPFVPLVPLGEPRRGVAGPPFGVRLALGASLAARGAMIKVAAALALLGALGGVAVAFSLASKGSGVALADLPAAMAKLLAWGPALLAAIAASSRAFEEDRTDRKSVV